MSNKKHEALDRLTAEIYSIGFLAGWRRRNADPTPLLTKDVFDSIIDDVYDDVRQATEKWAKVIFNGR